MNHQLTRILRSCGHSVSTERNGPDLNQTIPAWGGVVEKHKSDLAASKLGVKVEAELKLTMGFKTKARAEMKPVMVAK